MADHQKTPTVRDWENREFNETVSWNLRKLLDYMNTFDLSVRFKLGQVNEKLEVLERQVEYLESCYSTLTIQTQS